jgi:hypothetical protein
MASPLAAGSIASSTQSAWVKIKGRFDMILSGTWTGTATLQTRNDGGDALPVVSDGAGTAFAPTANGVYPLDEEMDGREFRIDFTRTGGTLVWAFHAK